MSSDIKLTEKRRQWLIDLRDNGPQHSQSPVGYYCRIAGWTEWFVSLHDGRNLPISEAYALFPDLPNHEVWDQFTNVHGFECITPAGRSKLQEQDRV